MPTPGILVEFPRQDGLSADGRARAFPAAADDGGWVECEVTDDGTGFDAEGAETAAGGAGLSNMRDRLDVPVMCGVGAAFDMHAGLLPQAPSWMQRAGLEWFYRLCREPRRLWRRYLANNPRFVVRILRHPPRVLGG